MQKQYTCLDCKETFTINTGGAAPKRCRPCWRTMEKERCREKAKKWRSEHPEEARARSKASNEITKAKKLAEFRPRVYTCADCGEIGETESRKGTLPSRCAPCRWIQSCKYTADFKARKIAEDPQWLDKLRTKAREYQRSQRSERSPSDKLAATIRQKEWMYSLGTGGFEQLLESQCGKCASCDDELIPGNSTHVDHDHACCPGGSTKKCGKCTRGILCGGCNTAAGMLKDDPVRATALVEYLRKTRNVLPPSDLV